MGNYHFKGEKNNNCKLSDKEIKELKKEWKSGSWTLRKMAVRYGISHSHVYKIIHDKTRVNV